MYFNEDEDYITIDFSKDIHNRKDNINNSSYEKIKFFFKSQKENIYLLTLFIIFYYFYLFYFIRYI